MLPPLYSDSFKPLDGTEVFHSLPVGLSDMSLEVLNPLTDDIQPGNHHSFDDQPVPSYQDSAGASLEKENSSVEVAVNLSITSDGDFNPSSTSTAKKKQTRTYNAPDKITRKRLANPQNWKKNVNKEKIARGEEYVTFKGKTIKAHSLQRPCDECCRLKCSSKVTEEDRMKIFETFWKKLLNKQAKWLFLNSYVQQFHKQQSKQEKSRRANSRKYFLPVNESRVQVCKVMFLATLDISDGQITTATKKGKGSPDKRGRNPRGPSMTVNPALKQSVRDHLQSLPRIPSHYVRKDSQREYLTGNLESIAQLHEIYLEWMQENSPNVQEVASYRQYSDIFNTEFNIGFFLAKKDQCDLCVEYENSSEEEMKNLQETYEDHKKNSTLAQTMRLADSEVAKQKGSKPVAVFCFDFEKTLICPKAKASVFYYKRKLSVNNFTVSRVGKTNEDICYVYDETIARKGSNEVASFLCHFMTSKVEEGVTDFRMYCDNCWGQNKNKAVASFLATFTQIFKDKNVSVVLRFLEKGHSYNSADTVHSLIERKTRKRDIYTPDEWYQCIETAKRSKTQPIKVIRVQQDMIFDWVELADKLNFIKDTEGGKIPFSKIREISAESSKPLQLQFKLSLDDTTSKTISLKKVGKPVNLATYQLKRVMNDGVGPLPISKKKKEDLLYYCSHNLIPQEHQDFFRNLPAGENDDQHDEDTIVLPQPGRERKRKPRQAPKRGKKRARLITEEEEEIVDGDVEPF